MSADSSLEAAVTRALEQHAFVVDPSSRDQPLRCMCQEGRCNEQGWMLTMEVGEHPAHVAAAVIEALGVELGEDLWDAQQCVQDWRDSHDCDDTRENRKRLAALAKRLRDVANQLAAAGSGS